MGFTYVSYWSNKEEILVNKFKKPHNFSDGHLTDHIKEMKEKAKKLAPKNVTKIVIETFYENGSVARTETINL